MEYFFFKYLFSLSATTTNVLDLLTSKADLLIGELSNYEDYHNKIAQISRTYGVPSHPGILYPNWVPKTHPSFISANYLLGLQGRLYIFIFCL